MISPANSACQRLYFGIWHCIYTLINISGTIHSIQFILYFVSHRALQIYCFHVIFIINKLYICKYNLFSFMLFMILFTTLSCFLHYVVFYIIYLYKFLLWSVCVIPSSNFLCQVSCPQLYMLLTLHGWPQARMWAVYLPREKNHPNLLNPPNGRPGFLCHFVKITVAPTLLREQLTHALSWWSHFRQRLHSIEGRRIITLLQDKKTFYNKHLIILHNYIERFT